MRPTMRPLGRCHMVSMAPTGSGMAATARQASAMAAMTAGGSGAGGPAWPAPCPRPGPRLPGPWRWPRSHGLGVPGEPGVRPGSPGRRSLTLPVGLGHGVREASLGRLPARAVHLRADVHAASKDIRQSKENLQVPGMRKSRLGRASLATGDRGAGFPPGLQRFRPEHDDVRLGGSGLLTPEPAFAYRQLRLSPQDQLSNGAHTKPFINPRT